MCPINECIQTRKIEELIPLSSEICKYSESKIKLTKDSMHACADKSIYEFNHEYTPG